MTLRRLIFKCVFGAVSALVFAAWNASGADASKPAEKIEFSTPTQGAWVTNVNDLGAAASDKETADPRSTTSFHPQTSDFELLAPIAPAPEVVVTRRSKDPLDSGLPGSPEDMLRDKLIKDLLRVPGFEQPGQSTEQGRSGHTVQSLYGQMLGGSTTETKSVWHYYDAFSVGGEQGKTSSGLNGPASPWVDNMGSHGDADSVLNPNSALIGSGAHSLWDSLSAEGYARVNNINENARAREAQQNQLKQMQQVLNGNYDLQPATPLSGAGGGSFGDSSTPAEPRSAASILANGPGSIGSTYSLSPPTAPT
ncbi:MAG TPA: hypothetical protein VFD66_04465, partial [Verrucomicrobiae bacterium]|nr:hypothetical protein [Verrucomicrobiae bacterium]